ncbi:MAG TPA: ComEC/Rec2 family competence protein, partial [Spirochaetota bacterium]
ILRYEETSPDRIVRALIYSLICVSSAAFSAHTAHTLSVKPASFSGNEFTARVTAKEAGRYTDRIVLALTPLRGETPTPFNAMAIIKKDKLREGDSLAIKSSPEKIAADEPFAAKRYEGVHYRIKLSDRDYTLLFREEYPLREKIRDSIILRNNTLYGEKSGSIINALYLGDSFFVDRKTTYDFTRAGVLHILAASGSHVAIIAGLPLFLLTILRIPRRASYVIVSLVLALYFYITCAPVSLLRACVMFWVFAIFRTVGNKCSPHNALYLSGSIILLLYPFDLFSIGFQLSFGATAGIIILYRFYRHVIPRFIFKTGDSLALTFSAQIGVFPIIALTLGQVNFTGILANLIIVPLIEIIMLGSIGTILLSYSGIYMTWAAQCIRKAMQCTLSLCEIFARMPGHFIFESFPSYLLISYILLLFPLFVQLRKKVFPITVAALLSAYIPCFLFLEQKAAPENAINLDGSKIITTLTSQENVRRAEATIHAAGYCIPAIALQDTTYESIHWCERFIQRNPVSEIVIPRSVQITPSFRSLCESADREGVLLRFADQPKK